MKRTLAAPLIVAGLLAVLSGPARAALTLDEFGAAALSLIATSNGELTNALDGAKNATSADSLLTQGDSLARGRAEFVGTVGLPELGARSLAGASDSVFAIALAAQGYTYTGTPGTVTFDVGIDGTNSGPASMQLAAYLYRVDADFMFPDIEQPTLSSDATLDEVLAAAAAAVDDLQGGVDLGAIDTVDSFGPLVFGDPVVDHTETLSITFDGVESDRFYVVSALATYAALGGDANALNTVTFTTSAEDDLTPSAVPLPGGLGLLASAGLWLAAVRGRRRRRPGMTPRR